MVLTEIHQNNSNFSAASTPSLTLKAMVSASQRSVYRGSSPTLLSKDQSQSSLLKRSSRTTSVQFSDLAVSANMNDENVDCSNRNSEHRPNAGSLTLKTTSSKRRVSSARSSLVFKDLTSKPSSRPRSLEAAVGPNPTILAGSTIRSPKEDAHSVLQAVTTASDSHQMKQLKMLNKVLFQRLAEMQDSISENLHVLEYELEQRDGKIKELSDKVMEMSEMVELKEQQANGLCGKIEALKMEITERQQRMDDLYVAYQQAQEIITSLNAEKHRQAETIQTLESRNETQEYKYGILLQLNKQLIEKLKTSQQSAETFRLMFFALRDHYIHENAVQMTRMEKLEKELEEKKLENEQLQHALQEKSSHVEHLHCKVDALETQLVVANNAHDQKMEHAKNINSILHAELANAREEYQRISTKCMDLEATIKSLETVVKQVTAERDMLMKQLEDEAMSIQQLQKMFMRKAMQVNQEKKMRRQERMQLASELEEALHQIKEKEVMIEELKVRMEELDQSLDKQRDKQLEQSEQQQRRFEEFSFAQEASPTNAVAAAADRMVPDYSATALNDLTELFCQLEEEKQHIQLELQLTQARLRRKRVEMMKVECESERLSVEQENEYQTMLSMLQNQLKDAEARYQHICKDFVRLEMDKVRLQDQIQQMHEDQGENVFQLTERRNCMSSSSCEDSMFYLRQRMYKQQQMFRNTMQDINRLSKILSLEDRNDICREMHQLGQDASPIANRMESFHDGADTMTTPQNNQGVLFVQITSPMASVIFDDMSTAPTAPAAVMEQDDSESSLYARHSLDMKPPSKHFARGKSSPGTGSKYKITTVRLFEALRKLFIKDSTI